MNLQLIKAEIEQYADFLASTQSRENLHLWESLAVWKKHDIFLQDQFVSELEMATQNSTTRRMWKKERYEPIKMISILYQLDPSFVISMFSQLFQSSEIGSDEIDRFKFLADTMHVSYREKHPLSPENDHFQTSSTVTKYLAHQFPEKYSIYAHQPFVDFLNRVKATEVQDYEDLDRFRKVSNIVGKFISSYGDNQKNIQSLHAARTEGYPSILIPSQPMFFYEMLHVNADYPIHY